MMMNCKQVTKLVSDSLERQLSLKEKIPLTAHIMLCSGCRHFAKQMQIIHQLSQQFAHDDNTAAAEDNQPHS